MERKYDREDVDYETWYTPWMKMLAKNKTIFEIKKELGIATKEVSSAAAMHLKAIEKTTSMQSNSMARASSRNCIAGAGEYKGALSGALEIYELFPEHGKEVTKHNH